MKHFGFKTDEAKSHWRMENRMGTRDVPAQGELVSSGNRGRDTSMAKGKLNDVILLAEHVETINGFKMDTRKIESPWLITSKSMARALYFETRVVKLGVTAPMTVVLEDKTGGICEQLLDNLLREEDWTRARLPTALDGLGLGSTRTLQEH